jgi:hypothetical protein
LCSGSSGPPCATGETLRAVDVAPDGSALAGGDRAALLWRPANSDFRTIPTPPTDPGARITGVAMPIPGRAWIATDRGEVLAGRQEGGQWTWEQTPENVNRQGALLTVGAEGEGARALRAIAVDASGRGYAVGDGGTVLERTAERTVPWRRVTLGVSDDFTAVALPRGGGGGALIGADAGAIWTRADGRFQLARPASVVDGYAGYGGAHVSGLALVPGDQAGQTEAWAALDGPNAGGALLHYASNAGDTLLTPAKPADPQPDAPAPRPGELSFVAFGKSDCANDGLASCPGPSGTDALSDVVPRRIVRAVSSAIRRPGGPRFAVFTGDANDHGGDVAGASRPAPLDEWVDLVARPLDEAGAPVLGAIGTLDLSDTAKCVQLSGVCMSSQQATRAGANVFWRQAMVDRVGQDAGPEAFDGLRYRPVRDDVLSPTPDTSVPGGVPDGTPSSLATGGARTHYAVDVLRADRPLLRLVFADNSLGSLRASDPLQQPPEPRGQLAWLDRVLASRPRGERAVVVSTSPSYSYEPRTVTDAASDGASLEDVALKRGASAVVAGRLGWNTLYYTLAPGLHCPAPGGAYPAHPPAGPGDCGRAAGPSLTDPSGSRQVADALQGLNAPTVPDTSTQTSSHGAAVPFVVASSAGGKLAQSSGQGQGYWHGYSVVRIDASGDPTKTVVEQRPILDWLIITASERKLRPRETIALHGVGREPPAADTAPAFLRLTDLSITHRYDLVLADPAKPWLPYRDADGRYVAFADRYPNCSVACVDGQTGELSTGDGVDHRVYGVALLSVGDLTATYPLAFEPRALRAPPASAQRLVRGGWPAPGQRVGSAGSPTANAPRSTSSPYGPLERPIVPGLPATPSAGGPPPRPLTMIAPPASPAPLVAPPAQVARGPPALLDVPRVTPVPPHVPPIRPAPQQVSPQRDEVAQHQAALTGFEDDSPLASDEALDAQADLMWVDLAQAPSVPRGAETTRRTTRRSDLAMTAHRAAEQPSAWTRNALYGSGLTFAALILATGCLALRRGRSGPAPATCTASTPSRRSW